MPRFECTIIKSNGKRQTLTLDVDSEQQAAELLADRGYTIVSIVPEGGVMTGCFKLFLMLGLLAVVGLLVVVVRFPKLLERFEFSEVQRTPKIYLEGRFAEGKPVVKGKKVDFVRLLIRFPRLERSVDLTHVPLDDKGTFRVEIPLITESLPASCSVTLGVAGYSTLEFTDLSISGSPPTCRLPDIKLGGTLRNVVDKDTSSSGSVDYEATPTVSSNSSKEIPKVVVNPSGSWRKTKFFVMPGSGVEGLFKLGTPLNDKLEKFLGKPDLVEPRITVWGKLTEDHKKLLQGVWVKLNAKGKVERIIFRGVRAVTDEGVFIGASRDKVTRVYQQAQLEIAPRGGVELWRIPGAVFSVVKNKVVEIQVVPLLEQAWRFVDFKVEPGLRAGPLELGMPVTKDIIEELGTPDVMKRANPQRLRSGLVRWGNEKSEHFVEVTLHNGRSVNGVASIRLRGVKAYTVDGVGLGDTLDKLKEVYPNARDMEPRKVGKEIFSVFTVKGVEFWVRDDFIEELVVN